MSIKRTGGRKPTMGNWRCEYMAQSEYAVCKCCHINGDLHMDARQIYRRFLYPVTRALLATCALGLTPARLPRVFLRDFRDYHMRRNVPTPYRFANIFFIHAPVERVSALFARGFRIDRDCERGIKRENRDIHRLGF